MNIFKFLFSKAFLINIVAAIMVIGILAWGVLRLLDIYTLHGETITVPDLKGYTAGDIDHIVEQRGLRYMVIDSVYDSNSQPGVIIEQDPRPEFQVKKNRMLYLTVNASTPPKVTMPDLIDMSLRQAMAILESSGLKVGNLSYVPDIAHNAVLFQEFKGKPIEAGETIFKGSSIDLVLGQGISNEVIMLPQLVNMTLEEAIEALLASSLNPGSVIMDETVTDSTQAKVYRQIPAFYNEAVINIGSSVDLFLTQSPEKINGAQDAD